MGIPGAPRELVQDLPLEDDTAIHWDPIEEEKTYYRNEQSGQLAWVVRREGKEFMRLDRPSEEILLPCRRNAEGCPSGWKEEARPRLLGPGVIGRIAFEAYKALCGATGKAMRAKMEWLSLSEAARHDFIVRGPKNATPLERALWEAMSKVLKEQS